MERVKELAPVVSKTYPGAGCTGSARAIVMVSVPSTWKSSKGATRTLAVVTPAAIVTE